MNINKISAALLCLLAATPALAARHNTADPVRAQYSHRGQLVYDIVKTWGPHVQEVYHVRPQAWADEMGSIFKSASLDQLQRAADSNDFRKMNDILLGKQAPANSPTLLGDPDADLVYTPVAPCRIFDTRLAGGKITGGTTRAFDVSSTSSYTGQGGSATDCGVGSLANFAAAVINFTVVDAAAAPSFLTAYAWNTTRPVAATMAYSGGNLVSNSAVVPLDQTANADEMNVYLNGTAHVVGDIVGYYDVPEATPHDCLVTTTYNGYIFDTADRDHSISAPACNAGYERVGLVTGANGDYTKVQTGIMGASYAWFHYSGGTSVEVKLYSRCCRVPGK